MTATAPRDAVTCRPDEGTLADLERFARLELESRDVEPWADLIAQRLAKARRRFGFDVKRRDLDVSQFSKPRAASSAGQGELFG